MAYGDCWPYAAWCLCPSLAADEGKLPLLWLSFGNHWALTPLPVPHPVCVCSSCLWLALSPFNPLEFGDWEPQDGQSPGGSEVNFRLTLKCPFPTSACARGAFGGMGTLSHVQGVFGILPVLVPVPHPSPSHGSPPARGFGAQPGWEHPQSHFGLGTGAAPSGAPCTHQPCLSCPRGGCRAMRGPRGCSQPCSWWEDSGCRRG